MARYRKHIALLALLAFLVNATLPFLATYNVPDHSAASLKAISTAFGDRIFICTGNGFKWVSLAELQKQKSPSHHPDSHFQCGLCYLAAHGLAHLALLGGIALAYAAYRRIHLRVAYAVRTNISSYHSFQYSRAPPAFFN
jgi:hypothetical protein